MDEFLNRLEAYRKFLKADRWEEWRKAETDQRKGVPAPPLQKPYPDDATLVDLVAPDDLAVGQMPLIEAIRQRRSRRQFAEAALSLEELSFLLWATQGVDQAATQAFQDWAAAKRGEPPRQPEFALRTVPSGGARHPFETYLLVQRVDELEPGMYRYLPLEHRLLLLEAGPELMARAANVFSGWPGRAAVIFVWTVIPYRTEWRYTFVSHKIIAQDSGHLCQNLYLASEAIGAGTTAIGAYDQEAVDGFLGIDGQDEFTVYVAPVGKVTPADYHFDH
jgi:SagB-type dehydrogenase family enzyme